MKGLKLVPSADEETKNQPIEKGLISPSLISSIYPEDKIDFFRNVSKARELLIRLLNGGNKNNGVAMCTGEKNLRYVEPGKVGQNFETTLQDIYFTFRDRITGGVYWIRLDRGKTDKNPIFDAKIHDCDWGEY